jgi:hypothetical protein
MTPYIYFEISYITGKNKTEPKIENENMLLTKPKTNSSGYWSFRHVTERMKRKTVAMGQKNESSDFLIVDQYWIDLEKFNIRESSIKNNVIAALDKIKQKL